MSDEKFAMALRYAKELAEAGVLYVEIGDIKLQLAPVSIDVPLSGLNDIEEDDAIGALEDPESFGSSGFVPGFERLRNRDREE